MQTIWNQEPDESITLRITHKSTVS